MSKHLWVIAVLAFSTAVGAAVSAPLVEENFEGSRFPPDGWTVDGVGVWGWSNPGGYADGYATATAENTSQCRINSPPFRLEVAGRVRASFRYEATKAGDVRAFFEIEISREGYEYWQGIPSTTGWEYYEWFSPVAPANVYHRISWLATVYCPYNSGTGVLRLDDVVLTAGTVCVQPTSIGRVKALYR